MLPNCRLLVAVAATMVSFNACANVLSGNALLAECSSNETVGRVACYRYVDGYVTGLKYGRSLGEIARGDAPVCIPQEATVVQLTDVGVRYLKAHPEIRDRAAAELLLAAFKEAWPCSPERGSSPTPSPAPQ
jgi:Rap1a immunity proteins